MLEQLLNDHRTGQDAMQLGSFVLGGKTPWGTYKQAIRELYKRIRGLRQMITDRDLLLIDMEEIQERISSKDNRDSRRAKIEFRSMCGRLEEVERGIRDTKREAALFYRTAAQLKEQFGEITEERRAELDIEEWEWWHLKRAAIAKMAQGRIDNVVLKNLISLPKKERQKWLPIIKDNPKIVIEQSEFGRIEVSAPTEQEIESIEKMAIEQETIETYKYKQDNALEFTIIKRPGPQHSA